MCEDTRSVQLRNTVRIGSIITLAKQKEVDEEEVELDGLRAPSSQPVPSVDLWR